MPGVLFETLEERLVLSVPTVGLDGSEKVRWATPLGKLAGALVVNNALSSGESSDCFAFSVRSLGNVNVTLSGLSANANLRLFNSSGKRIAISGNLHSRSEAISLSLGRGDYEVTVDRGKNAGDTNYSLRLQADLNYESVEVGGKAYTLGLIRADRSTAPIASDAETWVVIHGWLGSPSAVHGLSTAIDEASRHLQVLELDWSQVASDVNAVNVVFNVPDVGAWAASKLGSWGIAGGNINLVGHSYGGYMTDQIAKRISGGVDRLVALDPATAALGGVDFSGTNYAAHSQYSIAFVGSDYGTLSAAQTADETINTEVGKRSNFAAHAAVLQLFTAMTEQNNTRHHDNISPLFSLKEIGSAAARPFKKDAMGDGYEAVLMGRQSGVTWVPSTLSYVDRNSGKGVTIKA